MPTRLANATYSWVRGTVEDGTSLGNDTNNRNLKRQLHLNMRSTTCLSEESKREAPVRRPRRGSKSRPMTVRSSSRQATASGPDRRRTRQQLPGAAAGKNTYQRGDNRLKPADTTRLSGTAARKSCRPRNEARTQGRLAHGPAEASVIDDNKDSHTQPSTPCR